MEYAGFWLRFGAAIIDGIIMMVVYMVFSMIFGGMLGATAEAGGTINENAFIGGVLVLYAALIIGYWLYFALMESSSKQATLGKMAVGIVVTDMNGNRISFLKATGRHFGKIVSGMIFYIGYIMAGFTEQKQALHDMMAGCLVVRGKPDGISADVFN